MSSEDFVDALQMGKNLEAESSFKSAMQNKIGAALETKRREVANSFEKTIKDVAKKYRVSEKELMGYFEKEMLTI